jgi:hypothetical protein
VRCCSCIRFEDAKLPALSPNIENRVRKLPKPSNATQALQPIFEAVSNAMFAIEDRLGETSSKGRIDISVTDHTNPAKIRVIIADSGIGLDFDRYNAFCEIDTAFKQARGGKGVGRLFWLDAFSNINVVSTYGQDGKPLQRMFDFLLNNVEQVVPKYEDKPISGGDFGTSITFSGLRATEYIDTFPKRVDTFLRYFSAHFIADFLVGKGPSIFVDLDGDLTEYPKAIASLTVGAKLEAEFEHPDFGRIKIIGYTCKAEASTGLDGNHQLHLLANERTVETRKVDSLLGVTNLERDGESNLVFHGCVSGPYLDLRVNEGRTAFNLPEKTLKVISRACMDVVKAKLLPDQVANFIKQRQESYISFVERYPSFGFDTDETQLERVPFHATQAEDFASGLIKYQIRRDESRQTSLESLIDALDLDELPANLEASIASAVKEIQKSEHLALAQHVVRRKLALELLEKLIRRIRTRGDKADDHHLERTLHAFIVPMSIRGDDSSELKSRAHDLWIVDERLAFTRAFSSDKRLDAILADGGSGDRPDLFVWDLAYGLGTTDPDSPDVVDVSNLLRTVMVVEFKKPGRTTYTKAEDNIEQQITKYLAQLKGGEIESFERARVRIAEDCIFHCYVVADIVGDLELQLSNWATTSSGQGRIRQLSGSYRGQIEVVQWQDLVNDAWLRNRATLHAAGLRRNRPTRPKAAVEEALVSDEFEED